MQLQPRDLAVDLLVGHGSENNGCLDALVAFDGHIGLHIHLGFQNDLLVIHGYDVELGSGNYLLAGCVDYSGIVAVDDVVDGILKENAGAVHFFDNAAGSLAASETGDVKVFGLLMEDLRLFSLKGCGIFGKLNGAKILFVDL